MANSKKILILEDSENEAESIISYIKESGINFIKHVTENKSGYVEEIMSFKPDLIIADNSIGDFSGMEALKIRNEKAPQIPFILVTNSINEETAVKFMKAGADDYILKDNLSRLRYSVIEALSRKTVKSKKPELEREFARTKMIFDSLLNYSPVYIFVKNGNSEVIEFSRNFIDIVGIPADECVGKKISDLYPAPVAEKIMKSDKKIIRDKVQLKEISELNGRFYETTKFPIKVEGMGTCIAGFIVDITEKKKAENELNQEKLLLRKLIDNIPDLINIKDSQGRYILNNLPHMKSIGVDNSELVKGKTPFDFFSYEEAAEYRKDDEDVLKTGIPIINKEESAIQKDTMKRHWYLTSKIPLMDGKGQLTHLITISHDVTEKKISGETIERERMLLRTLIDNHPDFIYVKDRECRKVMANKADVENIGYNSEEEVIGKTDLELFPGETGIRGYNDDLSVINKGVRIVNKEEYFIDKNGNKKWIITTKVPLYDNEGNITGLVGIGRDITKIKETAIEIEKAKEKAEESDRFKTAFLNNITHEIRTPMNSIVGFASLLNEQGIDEETRNSYIEVINQSSNQLLAIVDDIIEISNLEAGISKLSIQKANLNKNLGGLFIQFQRQAFEKKIEFVFKPGLPDEESVIETDINKILQIITNLLWNAFKYTSEGKIEFGYTQEKGYIKFYVSDTGIGISEEHFQHIFERFYRVKNPGQTHPEGTGLGLAISKGYVELMGGQIWVNSVLGAGSTFYFTIPQVKTDGKNRTTNLEDNDMSSFKKTILVAEDEMNSYRFLQILLSKHGFNILHAENGKEAIEILKAGNKVDLVIMDMKMPVMDGYEAVRLIKNIKPDLPVISLTACALSDDREKSLMAGCDDYISKPVNIDNLISLIYKYTTKSLKESSGEGS